MIKAISISILLTYMSCLSIVSAEVVDESWRQVFEFQSKMAASGSNEAQFTLGEMYQHGRGVRQDYDTAIEWYNKAKKNGHSEASERIAMIHQSIQQQELDKQKAKAEAELARQQKEAEQKRAAEAEAKRKQKALKAKATKKSTAKKKNKVAKLNQEERAKKIKEAQERAKAIAKQNQLKQQQEAKAALERYKRQMQKTVKDGDKNQSQTAEKYIDPFE